MKKLEVEETKTTQYSTFKTDIIKVGLVFSISNFFIKKGSLANKWMIFIQLQLESFRKENYFFLFHCVFTICFFDIHTFNDRNENVLSLLWLSLKTQMNGNRNTPLIHIKNDSKKVVYFYKLRTDRYIYLAHVIEKPNLRIPNPQYFLLFK